MTIKHHYRDIDYIVNHVFMPTSLPQENEQEDNFSLDRALAAEIAHCAKVYRGAYSQTTSRRADSDGQESLNAIVDMLQGVADLHLDAPYETNDIIERFDSMTTGSITALLVRKQNAGIIVRLLKQEAIFEAFEVSPLAKEVIGCTGKLVCSFPGLCVCIPHTTFFEPEFRHELCSYIAQMNADELDISSAHSRKAGAKVVEVRETAHPCMITDVLLSILAAVGSHELHTAAHTISKRLADDVLWSNAYAPWRRSSLWLLIRVSAQTSFKTNTDYKCFLLYTMALIAKKAVTTSPSMSDDVLSQMRVKLCRRLSKLAAQAPQFLIDEVKSACKWLYSTIQERCEKQRRADMEADKLPALELKLSDVEADTRLELTDCFQYLGMIRSAHANMTSTTFTPNHAQRYSELSFDESLKAKLSSLSSGDLKIALHDFEEKVANELDAWAASKTPDIACLVRKLSVYHSVASENYIDNPENQSIMILTLLDMWRIIDVLTTRDIPLLSDYPPEVPSALIEKLLLRTDRELRRALELVRYLRRRESAAKHPSIFDSSVRKSSFSVRYFAMCSPMKTMLSSIETHATTRKEEKMAEVTAAQASQLHWRAVADATPHTCFKLSSSSDSRNKKKQYANQCESCKARKKARSKIARYEWPLPTDTLLQQALVFELLCPHGFSQWRQVTYTLLHEYLTPHTDASNLRVKVYGTAHEYMMTAFHHCSLKAPDGLTIASTTKPIHKSHYSLTPQFKEDDVIVKHAMTWQLYDHSSKSFVSQVFHAANVPWPSGPFMPEASPYTALAFTVDGVDHTENEVITKHVECPQFLSVDEFIAFGCMRSGSHLQWKNILRVIATRSLTFRQSAIHALLSQAICQVGEVTQSDKSVFERHVDLESESFCGTLLKAADSLLTDIKGNWLEITTLRTIVDVVARLLTSSTILSVIQEGTRLLALARATAYDWVITLLRNDSVLTDLALKRQLCEIAIACRLTYTKVDASIENFEPFVFCSIVIQSHSPSEPDRQLHALLGRSERLAYAFEEHLWSSKGVKSIDDAITLIWNRFQRTSDWTRCEKPNDRWIYCESCDGQVIQFNLIDGTLLVNGKPIGTLPKAITKHRSYLRLFGPTALPVVPSCQSDTEYQSIKSFDNWEIFFGIHGTFLVVRCRNTTSGVNMEYIPPEQFQHDLPIPYIEDHTHWASVSADGKSVIELRRLQTWLTDQPLWNIDFDTHVMTFRALGERNLVAPSSSTFAVVHRYVRGLEASSFVIVTLEATSRIHVSLPRYKLDFFVELHSIPQQFQCSTFMGFTVDPDQSFGSLHGLRSKLVLKEPLESSSTPPSLCANRSLLIPGGKVIIKRGSSGYCHISIQNDAYTSYIMYDIDTKLGRLRSNGGLDSHLFLAFLHAITSQHVHDGLTGRSGTEEALDILGSGRCRSFMRLSQPDFHILELLRNLTPRREYYPPHLETMQSVKWNDKLPISAQSSLYQVLVDRIVAYDLEIALCDESLMSPERSLAEHSPPHLLKRSRGQERLASSFLYDSGERLMEDKHYTRRVQSTETVSRLHYWAACMIWTGEIPRTIMRKSPEPLFRYFERWKIITEGHANEELISYSQSGLSLWEDWGSSWLSIYETCRDKSLSSNQKRAKLLFSLSAYAVVGSDVDLIPCIVAIARHGELPDPPHHNAYDISDGILPSQTTLSNIVSSHIRPIIGFSIPENYVQKLEDLGNAIVDALLQSWEKDSWRILPALGLGFHNRLERQEFEKDSASYYDIESITERAQDLFQSCAQNLALHKHSTEVEARINSLYSSVNPLALDWAYNHPESPLSSSVIKSGLSSDLLLCRPAPGRIQYFHHPSLEYHSPGSAPDAFSPDGASALSDMLVHLHDSGGIDALYASGLQHSLSYLEKSHIPVDPSPHSRRESASDNQIASANVYFMACQRQYLNNLSDCRGVLREISQQECVYGASGLWPSINVRFLLTYMTRNNWPLVSDKWKHALITLAMSLIRFQRSERILRFTLLSMSADLQKELASSLELDMNLALAHPDWLLIQIENNFAARDFQFDMAREMLDPKSNPEAHNVVLQLNMGEGKSSVIVPMVATSVADGRCLARIVVLKPLVKQMFQLLAQRVSGLSNRRICYLPFSRQLKLGPSDLQRIRDLYIECMKDGALLVAQPEHILSIKLLSVDRLLISPSMMDDGLATQALALQRWLVNNARDIFDESDELLHVRYQLIYTAGEQFLVEPHPSRWTVIQEVLALLGPIIFAIRNTLMDPSVCEVKEAPPWVFPVVKLPSHEEGCNFVKEVVNQMLESVLDGHVPSINVPTSPALRDAMRVYLTCLDDDSCRAPRSLLESHLGNSTTFEMILLLRGLLIHNILIYALRDRRWRVDYGLDPTRTMLAVPYRAKDMPSARSEFGHPEITIIFTCLSYYYGGLSPEQVETCLKHLISSSNPQVQYNLWTSEIPPSDLPVDLADPMCLNPEDATQRARVYALFQFNRKVINFFLNLVVFPRAARQFKSKLPSSGWDLAEKKKHITTGFSGTNDNRYLLPTSVRQGDLAAQLGTNALVLTHLLDPRNAVYIAAADIDGMAMTGPAFIQMIASYHEEIRVLLDVGAQILDLTNEEVARTWLATTNCCEAAIFFSGADELTTVTRDGKVQSLASSPFRAQTARCVVYLDDAHTRGTDLKLPRHWKAAVTLGKRVTKDRLVQGCMRMRQFGHGQTIVFFAPPEVDTAIRGQTGKQTPDASVDVTDVVRWTMHETCTDIRHHVGIWAQQGVDYLKRDYAFKALSVTPNRYQLIALQKAWLQPEARTLKEMYYQMSHLELGHPVPVEIHSKLTELGVSLEQLACHGVDEEQEREREAINEVEEERQKEVAKPSKAAKHQFSIEKLMKDGKQTLVSVKVALQPIPYWSEHASGSTIFSDNFLVSRDFHVTIQGDRQAALTVKPVQWVITNKVDNIPHLVVISQFEANIVIPMLPKQAASIRLHMYAPRTRKSMPIFDDLAFHCIPPLDASEHVQFQADYGNLIMQLNIFAGQLYPTSWKDFTRLTDFLGLANETSRQLEAGVDKFVKAENRDAQMKAICPFQKSPVRFLKKLLALRCRDTAFELTPMGKLLNGHRVLEKDVV